MYIKISMLWITFLDYVCPNYLKLYEDSSDLN